MILCWVSGIWCGGKRRPTHRLFWVVIVPILLEGRKEYVSVIMELGVLVVDHGAVCVQLVKAVPTSNVKLPSWHLLMSCSLVLPCIQKTARAWRSAAWKETLLVGVQIGTVFLEGTFVIYTKHHKNSRDFDPASTLKEFILRKYPETRTKILQRYSLQCSL